MDYLKSLGFKVNPSNRLLSTIEQIAEFHHSWEEKRGSLRYEADGIVVKVNQIALQERLGDVGREPRWSIAYKFAAVEGTTILKSIEISVGRTGTLNPYAVLEPVSVGGVTIKHAALHNEDDIRRKDIRIGDTVIIRRAGEVIPEVVGPVKSKRTGKEEEFSLPDKLYNKEEKRPACPVCGAEIFRPEGEVMYYCSNASCPAQAQQRIEHFASRGAMDIRGIGESQSSMLLKEGLAGNVSDLYYLKDKKERLLQIERMAELSVDNMLAAIEKSKNRPLARVIFALGIRHVGSETADILARRFHGIEALAKASREELINIEAVGPKIADSIVAFFHEETNQKIIERLRKAGVTLEEKVKSEKLPLAGMEFVITGRLEAFSRQEAETRIKALGGTAKDNVTRKTSYLVVGADPGGNKLTKAQELGTGQIKEEELLRLLGQK